MKAPEPDSLFFNKGDTIIFTRGEYSDYCFEGPFRALSSFHLKTVVASIVSDAWEKCKHSMSPFNAMEKLGLERQYHIADTLLDTNDYPLTDLIKEFITPLNLPSLLVSRKFIEPVRSREFHLGEYSELSFME